MATVATGAHEQLQQALAEWNAIRKGYPATSVFISFLKKEHL